MQNFLFNSIINNNREIERITKKNSKKKYFFCANFQRNIKKKILKLCVRVSAFFFSIKITFLLRKNNNRF